MKMKFKLAVIALVMICTQSAFSQTKTVTGTVSDESGIPLGGVTVLVVGTSNGASTDFDGNYTLNNVKPTNQLAYSYVGMFGQTITVGSQTKIDVILKESLQALSEVVVVGYGKQSRATVTGAISTVKSEDISALPVTNAESALQGRAAGLTITNSGVPGSSPSVLIRGLGSVGNNNPLYVIDGVIVGNLSGISPNDIESVSVLKDASTTAVYGAQGSSGVVVVTTKKGKNGKGRLNFNTYTGFQTVAKRYDVLETIDYLKYAGELGVFPNRPLSTYKTNTDWQDEIFRVGLLQDYNVSYSGGTENSTHLFSAEYLKQEGTIIDTGFERYSFRANSSAKFGKITVGESMSLSFGKQNPERDEEGRTLIEHAIKSAPYLSVYNSNNLGGFQGPSSSADGQDAVNAVRAQTLGSAVNKTLGIIGNVYAELEIIEGLNFKSQVGLDYYTYNNSSFKPSYSDDSIEGSSTHKQEYAAISRNSGNGQTIIFDNSLTYNTTINDKHNIEVLALVEKYEGQNQSQSASSQNAVTDEVNQLSNEFSSISSSSSEVNKIGYLGRLNYDYEGKYIASASFRRDASSRFGANKRWANFYSASAGWNIAKEGFMEGLDFSNLKLRASYGTVGSDAIGNYLYAPSLTGGFEYPIGGAVAFGVTANGGSNQDLQWETKEIINVGLDLGLFNEKFTASLEYYQNTSDELLIYIPSVLSSGINAGSLPVNAGSVETKGFELVLGFNDYEGDFTWSANLNLGTSKNEVLSLGARDQITGSPYKLGGADVTRTVVGESLFHFYGLVTDGIYQTQDEVKEVLWANPNQVIVKPGDIRFKDLDGNGMINSDDRAIIGNPFPDLTYGLNLDAKYKNFDMSLFITGVAGNEIFNTNTYDLVGGANRLFNVSQSYYDNKWSVTNPTGTEPRILGAPQNNGISDRFVEDGSYTRLKNVSLGYTFPTGMFENYFSKLRVYVSGQNLVTISDYSGLDPEIGGGEFGIDRGKYPQPKSVLVGVQVSF
ncbi:TonB-linked SusC/RagA family outer membrane protein [Mariniflexile fucanivorans]|uniref:TonB-linked SusC/RagA family outer membrane protein n=1 Tax=Mariniflexile fucanivorans TaxID=264023 RepID=A0A4V6NGS7_9FLAO|nr:TonB-dependent receptor [Mariniflexile fucanivorans]TCL62357.1 TonB-linked SusC/RagA family outer membrane protein [Mariniflexile fucanivorans]